MDVQTCTMQLESCKSDIIFFLKKYTSHNLTLQDALFNITSCSIILSFWHIQNMSQKTTGESKQKRDTVSLLQLLLFFYFTVFEKEKVILLALICSCNGTY